MSPAIIAAFILTYTKYIKIYYQTIVTILMIFLNICIVLTIAQTYEQETAYYTYYVGIILIIICTIPLRLRFIPTIISIISVLIFYSIIAIFIQNMLHDDEVINKLVLFTSNLSDISAAGLGVGIAAYFIERSERQNFIQQKALKTLSITKDKFFSIISHDLRGPMGSLMKLSELLNDEYDTIDNEDREIFMKEIKDSSKNLFDMLENLLTWSRTQKGAIEYNPEEIKLIKIIHHIFKYLKILAASKNIELISDIGEDVIVFADENMLKTILRNLISNSIKFTPEQGKIHVSLKQDKDSNILTVSDTGLGMDEETRNKLFRIDVHQTSEGTAGEKGTGLGLILCKEFVESHG
ncbi:sensor histidine kinase [Bacteroidota bacterium]